MKISIIYKRLKICQYSQINQIMIIQSMGNLCNKIFKQKTQSQAKLEQKEPQPVNQASQYASSAQIEEKVQQKIEQQPSLGVIKIKNYDLAVICKELSEIPSDIKQSTSTLVIKFTYPIPVMHNDYCFDDEDYGTTCFSDLYTNAEKLSRQLSQFKNLRSFILYMRHPLWNDSNALVSLRKPLKELPLMQNLQIYIDPKYWVYQAINNSWTNPLKESLKTIKIEYVKWDWE